MGVTVSTFGEPTRHYDAFGNELERPDGRPRRRGLADHLSRLCAERNDDRVHVFANGHVYDRAERRRSVRQLVAIVRRDRAAERRVGSAP